MKKFLLIPVILFAALSMAACVGSDEQPFTQPVIPEQPGGDDSDPVTPTPGGNGRYLVLYASRSGNTERVAQLIRTTLDCDMLEVEPRTPYDNDYNAMLERVQEELAAIGQGSYPAVTLRSKVSITTRWCSSVIRSGTVRWPRRCSRSCTPTLRNWPESGLHCSPPAEAAEYRHR